MGAFDKAGPSDKFNSPDSWLIPARRRGYIGEGVHGGQDKPRVFFRKVSFCETERPKDDGLNREIDEGP